MDGGHGFDDDIAFKPGHGGHLSFYSLTHSHRRRGATQQGAGKAPSHESFRKGKRGCCMEAFPPPRKALEGSRSILIGSAGESPPRRHVQKRVRHVQVGPALRSHALCLDRRVILPFATCLTRQLDPTPPPARCPRPLPPSRSPPLPAAPATPCASLPAPLTSRSRSGTQTHRNGLRFSSPFPFRSPASRHHHSHQVPLQPSRTTSPHASPSPLHSDSSFALFQPVSDFFSRQKVRKSCPLSCVLISDLYLRVCGFPMHVDRMQWFLCSFGFGFDGPRNVDRER